jgi:hypothetical protein
LKINILVKFVKCFPGVIYLREEEERLVKLRSLAREKGIGPTTLARILVLERLQEIERERAAR